MARFLTAAESSVTRGDGATLRSESAETVRAGFDGTGKIPRLTGNDETLFRWKAVENGQ